MKKKYLILSFVLLCTISSKINAQVVNGNFEIVKPNFLPSNWGMNFFQNVFINPITGELITDTIQYTTSIPSMVYATTQAHSGQYAMELSNAYNQTQNRVIAGEAVIFGDDTQDFPGWNAGIPIGIGANIQTLGFHYKFLPAGNDIAQAKINVFDADGNEIGTTSIDISGTNNQFNYIYSYINYADYNAIPAFMNISFTMAKEGTNPTFGSRLIIDNVVTNLNPLNVFALTPTSSLFSIYPTLVDDSINIVPSTDTLGTINYKIFNTQGRLVIETNAENESTYVYTMDVSNLSSGIYLLEITTSSEKIIKKFVKK